MTSLGLEFDLREVRIPFRFRYGHALHRHQDLAAVICIVRDAERSEGLGEAVPRDYVTGENCQSVMRAAQALAEQVTGIGDDPATVASQRWQTALDQRGPFPSCAFSAIDTALVDLASRRANVPAARYLGASDEQPLAYTASIGMSGRAMLLAILRLYRLLGFRRFKLKVGGPNDEQRVRLVRDRLGSDVEIFADANASWDRDTAAAKIDMLAAYGVWAIEEPLRHRQAEPSADGQLDRLATLDDRHYQDCRWLRKRSPIPLIADESLICPHSLVRIIDHKAFDILNIRLSKCGGPWMCNKMVQEARRHGLRFAVGAMVGETPILATAGAHFAAAHPDRLYVQGFSHRLLHRRKFVSGQPTWKRAAVHWSNGRAGWGLRLNRRRLDAITVSQQQVNR